MQPAVRVSHLSLRGITVTYPDGHVALAPTSLDVEQGGFLVLLGASGAGKSTLLRSINSLVRPTGGQVSVADLPGGIVSKKNLQEHRRRCGMVFQQHHLIGRQSVLANVLVGKLSSRGSVASLWPWSQSDKLEALAAIDRVGLLEKALARADTLSGGQQQRIGIARALVQKPRLLLADEPVASLDPATAQSVLTLLHDICKTDRLTAIVSLHQVNLARLFADRIVGLSQGQVVFDGTAAELTEAVQASLYARSSPGESSRSDPAAHAGSPADPSLQSKECLPC
jgi:phosphonate transport system ATP-binding protein